MKGNEKNQFLRPRCKIAVKKYKSDLINFKRSILTEVYWPEVKYAKGVKGKEVNKLLRYISHSALYVSMFLPEYSFIIHYIIYILLQQQT